jgi:hypothetical protein
MANPFAGVANAFIAGREQRDMRNERAEQKNLMLTQRQQEVDRAYGMNLFEMAKDTPPESHQQLFDYFVQNAERFGATPPPLRFSDYRATIGSDVPGAEGRKRTAGASGRGRQARIPPEKRGRRSAGLR